MKELEEAVVYKPTAIRPQFLKFIGFAASLASDCAT